MPNRFQPTVRSVSLTLVALGLAALYGCVTVGPRPVTTTLVYPSPLAGPGVPMLTRAARHAIAKGFKAVAAGRPEAGAAAAQRAGESPAATVLEAQAKLTADPATAQRLLSGVVHREPGYAAAWLTLSVAAERAGDEKTALDAARRGVELWPEARWRRRVADLENHWITARLEQARSALAEGHFAEVLAKTNAVLVLDPSNIDAHLLAADALLGQGKIDEADAKLAGLPQAPKVIAMRGRIAESAHRWADAMNLYESLPAGFPGRQTMLARAKNRWRISNLPAYVGEAIDSGNIDRAQLAILLVDLVPEVPAMATGPSPVLPDIVGLPEQREIVAAVRAGLLNADDVEHRFFPKRPATPAEVRTAVKRLARMLGYPEPTWCTKTETPAGCIQLTSPVSGHAVFEALGPFLDAGGSR